MLLDDYKDMYSESADEQLLSEEDMDELVEFIRESGYLEIDDDYSVYSEATIRTGNMTNKKQVMSKKQYEKLVASKAALAAARADNNSDYARLVKISKLRRKLIAKLNQRYAGVSRKAAKAAIKKAKKTNNTIIKTTKEGVGGTNHTNLKPEKHK